MAIIQSGVARHELPQVKPPPPFIYPERVVSAPAGDDSNLSGFGK
jgi:hypothetical protein